jgi:hypothetical protein
MAAGSKLLGSPGAQVVRVIRVVGVISLRIITLRMIIPNNSKNNKA